MTWKAFLQAKLRRKLRDPLYVSLMHARIAYDLLRDGLDTCKPINPHRGTAHLTAILPGLPDDMTLVDMSRTSIDFYTSTTSRMEAV
jgi:hypothetical protein